MNPHEHTILCLLMVLTIPFLNLFLCIALSDIDFSIMDRDFLPECVLFSDVIVSTWQVTSSGIVLSRCTGSHDNDHDHRAALNPEDWRSMIEINVPNMQPQNMKRVKISIWTGKLPGRYTCSSRTTTDVPFSLVIIVLFPRSTSRV